MLPLEASPKGVRPAPREDLIEELDRILINKTPKETLHLIFDRFPLISERVYGPTLRGQSELTEGDYIKYDIALRRHTPLVIFCDRPTDRILASFDEREQLEGVEERIEDLRKLYEKTIQGMEFTWYVRYDYEEPYAWEHVMKAVRYYLLRKGY